MPLRIPLRFTFQKTGRLKYLSHLDTMRAFTRALSRSGLPVWYTEGYNPRIHISFTMSLSLGYEGLDESFSLYLLEELEAEDIMLTINKFLPEELSVVRIATPVEKVNAITWADYLLEIYYDAPSDETVQALENFLSQTEIVAEKTTKKITHQIDLKSAIAAYKITAKETYVQLIVRIATGISYNINPRILTEAFSKFYEKEPRHVAYTRTAFYNQSEQPFL